LAEYYVCTLLHLLSLPLHPPTSTLFPYTTLFRSRAPADAPALPLRRQPPAPPRAALAGGLLGDRLRGRAHRALPRNPAGRRAGRAHGALRGVGPRLPSRRARGPSERALAPARRAARGSGRARRERRR